MSRVPKSVVEAVRERAGGFCEACGLTLTPELSPLHHRQKRSQGGKDTADNLVWLHPLCHDWVHAHPTLAYERGLMVRRGHDPAEIPVTAILVERRNSA